MDDKRYPPHSPPYVDQRHPHAHQNPGYYPPPGQPIQTQPAPMMQHHQTTVVVAGGGGAAVRPMRDWSTNLCGCFDDVTSCLLVMFCMECYGCYLSAKAGETCCLPCCVPAWLIALRSHTRGKHNIQGSICDDCCKVTCCYPCVMCQLSREIDNINFGRAAQ